MKKMEISQMENLQGGRPFIGTGTVNHSTVNGCTWTCNQSYFFWIKVGEETGCSTPVCEGSF